MIALFCMPCSAKSEFKRTFNIPVAENIDKNYKSAICSVSVLTSFKEISNTTIQKKVPVVFDFTYFLTYTEAELFKQKFIAFSKSETLNYTPIYIINEQYLI